MRFNLNLISKHRSELMGFAMLWILLLHMSCKFPFPISVIQSLGSTGVDIFFFVSAVGLYYSYSNNHNTLQFYKRRFLRIIPIYLILAVPYRIYDCFIVTKNAEIWVVIKNLISKVLLVDFFKTGNRSLWYIPAIIIFYLFYPVLYKLFDTKHKLKIRITFLIIISICAIVSNYFLTYYDLPHPTDQWILRIPIFLLGCFSAPYIKNNYTVRLNNILLIAFSVIIVAVYTFLNIKTGYLFWNGISWTCLINSMLAVPLLVLIPQISEHIKPQIINKTLSEIGKYTLEIYILNEATLCFARRQTEISILIDLISFSITIVLVLIIRKIKTFSLRNN